MVSLYVAITDRDWFEFLRGLPRADDVNFWQPGGRTQFRALVPGELFLFKLHSPDNFIVGGGVFAHSSLLPVSLAWETFQVRNGSSSLEEMRERIRRYRSEKIDSKEDFQIGCRIINSPFFFNKDDWIPVPPSFARQVQQGKRYDALNGDGRWIWDQVHSLVENRSVAGLQEAQHRYGDPALILPRLGQEGFRIAVIDAYERKCAVTGERILPVLEAAHIRPYSSGGEHTLGNALLLRTDLHRLFDKGYATVAKSFRFEVSRRIKEDFNNGKYYYDMHGMKIRVPRLVDSRPDPTALEWHNTNVFLG